MGWSEQYWEDVKAELEQSASESKPAGEDETPRDLAFGESQTTSEAAAGASGA